MPITIVLGTQWGDEGKGAVVDRLARNVKIVVRPQGGRNAGHSVNPDGECECVLHTMPCGILHDHVISMIGAGVVIAPEYLIGEIEGLTNRGIDITPDRLKISRAANIILPSHVALDIAREEHRGKNAIGTTKSGIGPAYSDRVLRIGLRADLFDSDRLADEANQLIDEHNQILTGVYGAQPVDKSKIVSELELQAKKLAPFLADVSLLVREALAKNEEVLSEGAQGTGLDLVHSGCPPYHTSSHTTVGGAIVGIGFSPLYIRKIIGVIKAYTTRVGGGPFPTEQDNETGKRIQSIGREIGASTGRIRRCGWLDLVLAAHSVSLNGITELVMTKLDVLSEFDKLEIATAYRVNGRSISNYPGEAHSSYLSQCRPFYVPVDGWMTDIADFREWDHLPEKTREYVTLAETFLKVPITQIGVGRERGAVINVPHT